MEAYLTPAIVGFFCLLGVVMTAVRLPGTWVLLVTAIAYGWWTDWAQVGWVPISILTAVAVFGEGVEILASVMSARRAGATRQAAWGALIGGFIGMLFLSFLVPIPLIGSMVGAVVGCFGGALVTELAMAKSLAQGAKVGVFAAIGFAIGTATKVAVALAMAVFILFFAVCPSTDPATDAELDLLVNADNAGFEDRAQSAAGAWDRPDVLDFHAFHDGAACG